MLKARFIGNEYYTKHKCFFYQFSFYLIVNKSNRLFCLQDYRLNNRCQRNLVQNRKTQITTGRRRKRRGPYAHKISWVILLFNIFIEYNIFLYFLKYFIHHFKYNILKRPGRTWFPTNITMIYCKLYNTVLFNITLLFACISAGQHSRLINWRNWNERSRELHTPTCSPEKN